jgi:hypothetical protein
MPTQSDSPDFSRPYEDTYEELDLDDEPAHDGKDGNDNNRSANTSRDPWQSSSRSQSYASDYSVPSIAGSAPAPVTISSTAYGRPAPHAQAPAQAQGPQDAGFDFSRDRSSTATGVEGYELESESAWGDDKRMSSGTTSSPSLGMGTSGQAATDGGGAGSTSANASARTSRSKRDVPVVLGVAVVDFNHLVSNSLLLMSIRRQPWYHRQQQVSPVGKGCGSYVLLEHGVYPPLTSCRIG